MKKFFDTLLIPLCFFVGFFINKKYKSRKKIYRNILVIRLYGMGDAITLLPVLKILKESSKGKITILTTNETEKIFRRTDLVDEIINWDTKPCRFILSFLNIILKLRKSNFDFVIDTEQFGKISAILSLLPKTNIRIGYVGLGKDSIYTYKVRFNDKKHNSDAFADLFQKILRMKRITRYVRLKLEDYAQEDVNKFLKENKVSYKNFIIGIHPGTGPTATIRRWPSEKFIELINRINRVPNVKVILIGSTPEKELVGHIQSKINRRPAVFFGRSFDVFLALLSKLDLFICNDSGPMHIAAALNTPVVGLFGPNTPVRWRPLGKKCISIYKNFPCSPCINTHKAIVPDKCPLYNSAKCMEAIEVKDVVAAVEKLKLQNR